MLLPTSPRFSPWNPPGDPRIYGVRLLVLGESHYEEPPLWIEDGRIIPADFTAGIIKDWGICPTRRHPFFAGVFECLTGERWENDSRRLSEFWHSLIFYNYVQKLVKGGARTAPSRADWTISHTVFRQTLEMLRPEAILVLGRRLWRNMEDEDVVVRESSDPLETVVGYRLADGRLIPAMHVRHPSSAGFRGADLNSQVRAFLQARRTPH